MLLNLLTGKLPWDDDKIVNAKKVFIKKYFSEFPKEFSIFCELTILIF